MCGCGCNQEGYCFDTIRKEVIHDKNELGHSFSFERETCTMCGKWHGDKLL